MKGDNRAQRHLFDRYYAYGYSIAQRYSSTTMDAEEILSSAFVRTFQKLHLYDVSRPFEHWFARLIIHASSDYYKKRKIHTSDIDDYAYKIADENPDIIDKLSYDELLSVIKQLSPQYRMVFNMYVIEEYKHAEIAEILNISIGTSKSNLNRAKSQLIKLLETYKHYSTNKNT